MGTKLIDEHGAEQTVDASPLHEAQTSKNSWLRIPDLRHRIGARCSLKA